MELASQRPKQLVETSLRVSVRKRWSLNVNVRRAEIFSDIG